jgi:hypothetical protein
MNPKQKWAIQLAISVVGIAKLLDAGHRRGWI